MTMTNKPKYSVFYTTKFKKDSRRAEKQGKDMRLLRNAVELLASGERMPVEYRDHALKGDMAGARECHIQPDWLLIYVIENNQLVLTLTRTGTHTELLGI